MINLYSIANNAIQVVNKNTPAIWKISRGHQTNPDGTVTPDYDEISVMAQIQSSSGETLRQLEGLNMEGVVRSIYITGNVQGVVRSDQRGGDLIEFPQTPEREAQTWKVVTVAETWDNWAHVIAKLQ